MKTLSLVLLGTMALTAEPAYPIASMRCGNDLVSAGDHLLEVVGKCGEPAYADRRMGYHVRRIDGKYHRIQREAHVPVRIETWVYDFGPKRFMQELQFVDGHLKRIDSLGRGYGSP